MFRVLFLISTVLVSRPALSLEICALYCPTETVAQCSLSWGQDGTCSCTCKTNLSLPDKADGSGDIPTLPVTLGSIDGKRLTLVPKLNAQAPSLSVPGVNAVHEPMIEGGGGCEPKEVKETPVTVEEVGKMIEEILVKCQLRGGC